VKGPGDDARDLMRDGTSASRAEQAAERGLGSRSFVASVALHVLLVVLIAVAGCVSFRKPKRSPLDELTEFTVAIPPEDPAPEPEKPEEPQKPEPEPEPDPVPEPEPAPVRDPIPVPVTTKPKPTRPPIDTSKAKLVHKTVPTTTRRIVPAPSTRPPPKTIGVHTRPTFSGPRLTPEEIRKLLDMGATVSDHTSIPADELHRCYALIQRQLYAAWVRPAAMGGGREPVVSITIGPGGVVRSASLKTPSGNPELDRSAVDAANAVRRFTGLSEDFVRENPTFTVAFKLEE
jgi:TonB family protein